MFGTICFPLRRLSNLALLLSKQNVFDKVVHTKEDVASIVRFNRDVNPITSVDFLELYSEDNNPDLCYFEREKIRLLIEQICCEYEYFRRTNMRVPTMITVDDMKILMRRSPERRQAFLTNAFYHDSKNDRKKLNQFVKKQFKNDKKCVPSSFGIFSDEGKLLILNNLINQLYNCTGEIQYGLWKNGLFLRTNYSSRLLIQSALSGITRGPVLAFDWHYDPNEFISSNFNKTLTYKIFILCNANLQLKTLPFEIIHLNLSKENIFFENLSEQFSKSSIDSRFFEYTPLSFEQQFVNKIMIYITPFATETLSESDMELFVDQKPIFLISPFNKKNKDFYQKRISMVCNEVNNVYCRKLPLHNVILQNQQVSIQNIFKCFRDVMSGVHCWSEAIQKHISKKRINKKLFDEL